MGGTRCAQRTTSEQQNLREDKFDLQQTTCQHCSPKQRHSQDCNCQRTLKKNANQKHARNHANMYTVFSDGAIAPVVSGIRRCHCVKCILSHFDNPQNKSKLKTRKRTSVLTTCGVFQNQGLTHSHRYELTTNMTVTHTCTTEAMQHIARHVRLHAACTYKLKRDTRNLQERATSNCHMSATAFAHRILFFESETGAGTIGPSGPRVLAPPPFP